MVILTDVGADILDMTGEQVMTFGELSLEDTWWALDPDQQIHFEGVQRVRIFLNFLNSEISNECYIKLY